MNRPAKLTHSQFNLLLVDVPKAVIPDEKQRELALALMELLIQSAQDTDEGTAKGGGDER